MSTKSKKSSPAKKAAKKSAPAGVKKPKGPFAEKDLLSLKGLLPEDLIQLFKLTDAMKKSPEPLEE